MSSRIHAGGGDAIRRIRQRPVSVRNEIRPARLGRLHEGVAPQAGAQRRTGSAGGERHEAGAVPVPREGMPVRRARNRVTQPADLLCLDGDGLDLRIGLEQDLRDRGDEGFRVESQVLRRRDVDDVS